MVPGLQSEHELIAASLNRPFTATSPNVVPALTRRRRAVNASRTDRHFFHHFLAPMLDATPGVSSEPTPTCSATFGHPSKDQPLIAVALGVLDHVVDTLEEHFECSFRVSIWSCPDLADRFDCLS